MFPAGQKLEDSLGNELYLGSKPNYIKPPGEASQPRYWNNVTIMAWVPDPSRTPAPKGIPADLDGGGPSAAAQTKRKEDEEDARGRGPRPQAPRPPPRRSGPSYAAALRGGPAAGVGRPTVVDEDDDDDDDDAAAAEVLGRDSGGAEEKGDD